MFGCRPFTDNEIDLISNSFNNERDKLLFMFNIYTGFRIQETLSIYVKDVYSNNIIKDRITVVRRNVKGKTRGRTVLMHPKLKESILSYIVKEGLTEECFLFQSRKGENRPIGRVQAWRTLNEAVKKNKLQGKVALHSTRKVFAQRVYSSLNKDIVKTSKALGHKSILSTVAYLSFNTEELDNVIVNMKEIK